MIKTRKVIFGFFILFINLRCLSNDMLKASDPIVGKEIFISCASCHSIKKGEVSQGSGELKYSGPNLFGVYKRKIASLEDYEYSNALKKHKGKKWTIKELSKWLKSPSSYAPKTKMKGGGILDPQDRMDLIRYLMSLK